MLVEEGVIDVARACFRAIPQGPLVGCDMIRKADTGKLFVLETNPGGNSDEQIGTESDCW